MASSNHRERPTGAGTLFGVPVADLGWFQVILMGLATGMTAFFLATFLSIVAMLFYTGSTHHPVDFAIAYKRIGFPIGVLVGLAALGFLSYQWVRRIVTKGRAG